MKLRIARKIAGRFFKSYNRDHKPILRRLNKGAEGRRFKQYKNWLALQPNSWRYSIFHWNCSEFKLSKIDF